MRMFLSLLLSLVLLLSATARSDARYSRRQKPDKRFRPELRAVTGFIGLGDVDGAPGLAMGGEYERTLLRNGLLTATASALAATGRTYDRDGPAAGETCLRMSIACLAPGLRLHPLQHRHRVDIGAGVSVPLGIGWYGSSYRDAYTGAVSRAGGSGFYAAVLGQLSVNFSLPRHSLFSVFLAGGPVLCHDRPNYNSSDPMLLYGGIRFGGWSKLR